MKCLICGAQVRTAVYGDLASAMRAHDEKHILDVLDMVLDLSPEAQETESLLRTIKELRALVKGVKRPHYWHQQERRKK